MAGEKAQWDGRKSFPFAVLNREGTKELGCFYLRPSSKEGYDVVATMWVTQEAFDQGFEDQLFRDMQTWVAKAWPFRKVAWRGGARDLEGGLARAAGQCGREVGVARRSARIASYGD